MSINIEKKIFDFAYELALRDATLQNAYTGSLGSLRQNDEAKRILKAYINAVLAGNANEALFWQTAQAIEASFDSFLDAGQPCFTFGNTQKLINMTAKYMFITCYQHNDLRNAFSVCHCPMDGIMVNTVIDELERALSSSSSFEEQQRIREFMSRGWKSYLRSPWSKIKSSNKEQYKTYQRIVRLLSDRNGVSPLEYDFLMWRN